MTRTRTAAAIRLAPGVLAVAVFLALADQGGFPPTRWYPAALFVGGLVLVALVVRGELGITADRASSVAALLLAGFAAWSFASIAWAGAKGDAWLGADRALLYALVFVLFALWRWTPFGAAALLGLYSLGTALLAAGVVVHAAVTESPADLLMMGGRLGEPTGYPNATAALLLAAFWPALLLGSRAECPLAIRAGGLAAAGVLIEVSVLPQSRATLFAFPLALAVYFAFVPGRARTAVALVPVGLALALSLDPLLDVYSAARAGTGLDAALNRAALAVGLSAAFLALAGVVLALAERRMAPGARAGRAGALAIVAAAAGATVAAALAVGNPVTRATDFWNEFRDVERQYEGATHFSGGFGSNRYDQWRVAASIVRDAPVLGVGADNYAAEYLRARRTNDEPLYPHSLELMIISQTGLVGGALFLGFLAFALAAAMRARRGAGPLGAAVIGAALASFGYWLAHGSVDWFWELPGLAAPAVAWLGISGSVRAAPEPEVGAASRSRFIVAAAGAAVVACTFTMPWLAARHVDRARAIWSADPVAAAAALDRARSLNPLSEQPDLIAGDIALYGHDWSGAVRSYRRALERRSGNWYAYLQLAVASSQLGRFDAGLRFVAEAERLNPREPVLDLVRSSLRQRRAVPPERLAAIFRARIDRRIR